MTRSKGSSERLEHRDPLLQERRILGVQLPESVGHSPDGSSLGGAISIVSHIEVVNDLGNAANRNVGSELSSQHLERARVAARDAAA